MPRRREKNRQTQGKYGALKERIPKTFILTNGFLLLHKYTNISVNACPRKASPTTVAKMTYNINLEGYKKGKHTKTAALKMNM